MRAIYVVVLLISLAGTAQAQIYRWVDANGTVHFSDSPPPGDAAEEVALAPQPSQQSLQQSREEAARLLQHQRAGVEARREAEATERRARDEAEQQAGERALRCAHAREQLRILGMQAPVYRENDAGEREYADDAFRASEQARFTQEVAEHCTP